MKVLPLEGGGEWTAGCVYCLGRNYMAHAREMGQHEKKPPLVFIKPAHTLTDLSAPVAVPTDRGEVHHEVEMVVGLTLPASLDGTGRELTPDEARAAISVWTVGLDLTLRDVQAEAKNQGRPWAASKSFPASGPIGPLRPITPDVDLEDLTISLTVNGELRQEGRTRDMLLTAVESVLALSREFPIASGDLVFTGTPAGVGPLTPGDELVVRLSPGFELATSVVAR